jgi:hypothetical protein
MSRHPQEYQKFDRLMGKLLTVSKDDLDRRVEAHKERAALNPRKRGPKPKPSASRGSGA